MNIQYTDTPEYNRECLCIRARPIQYELEAAGNFIAQFKNDYVKLGSIVECFLHLHSYRYNRREKKKLWNSIHM